MQSQLRLFTTALKPAIFRFTTRNVNIRLTGEPNVLKHNQLKHSRPEINAEPSAPKPILKTQFHRKRFFRAFCPAPQLSGSSPDGAMDVCSG
ncbi:hypothetical protein CEXT_230591 [Caerostris extrusa]|uniref:Uncharacterized protein n=1 Tax=Caerostris extrusa TaxID=172846 RepID=A0AAV4U9V4_CAEEX|nr:hypothetical protein CEXT_230591 [Caerostris extrusa]